MRYEVGDTVILLHSKEEGEVVEILGKDMVRVNVGGVDFPVFADQIDYPYFERFRNQSRQKKNRKRKVFVDQLPREKMKKPKKVLHEDRGVRLTFFPVYHPSDHSAIVSFKIYLVNQNSESYRFEYDVVNHGEVSMRLTNTIKGDGDFYLNNIEQEDLNDISKLVFRFSLSEPNQEKAEQYERILKIKARTFFTKVDEMERRNVPSFSFDLFTSYPERPWESYVPLPERKHSQPSRRTILGDPPKSVIDLHLDKILPHNKGLTNFEKMSFQLEYFEKYYQLAVVYMQPNLTVIHGVGSGKLKEEIHERLKTKKEVKSFTNLYHPLYGYGATQIFFQY